VASVALYSPCLFPEDGGTASGSSVVCTGVRVKNAFLCLRGTFVVCACVRATAIYRATLAVAQCPTRGATGWTSAIPRHACIDLHGGHCVRHSARADRNSHPRAPSGILSQRTRLPLFAFAGKQPGNLGLATASVRSLSEFHSTMS